METLFVIFFFFGGCCLARQKSGCHSYSDETLSVTLGVMLCVMQNCRCVRMLSMLWKACCRVVLRYFCMARAIGAKMACAASRGSITSLGCLGDDAASSSWRRLMCVKASSTATTNLEESREKHRQIISQQCVNKQTLCLIITD